MTASRTTWVVTALFEDSLVALNRVVGIVRRRQLPTDQIQLGPAGAPGVLRLTLVLPAEADEVSRLAGQLRKMVGVHRVAAWEAEAGIPLRELALIRVRAGGAALLDVLELYRAFVVEQAGEEAVVQAVGPPPLLTALLRALEPFGVLEVARSGPLALAAGRGDPAAASSPITPAVPLAALPA